MGNTHDTEIARIEADYIHTKWRTTEDYRWGYSNDRGPETWWVYYPSASGGMQSPIDVMTEEVTWDPDLCYNPLQICYRVETSQDSTEDDNLSNQNAREYMVLENTGNLARVKIRNSKSYITGGPCRNNIFLLDHVVLHWGDTDCSGSEHLINTHSSAAEVHLVHWNEDLYENFIEASKREDGIVIVSVLVEINEERSNKGLQHMAGMLQDIVYRRQSAAIHAEFDAAIFLPDDLSKYWTYKGSFTTPPCYETVTWIVFHDSISITSDDLSKFRCLRSYEETEMRPGDEFDGRISRNCRVIQPMGTRKVYTTENIRNQYLASYDHPFRQQSSPTSTSATQRISTFPECIRQCGRA